MPSTVERTRARLARRRRRPSGDPAPLPHLPFAGWGKVWLALLGAVVFILVWLISPLQFGLGSGTRWDELDAALQEPFVAIRTGWLTSVALGVRWLGNTWVLRTVGMAVVMALVVFRRWRHLSVYGLTVLTTGPLVWALGNRMARPRPDGIEILSEWSGFSHPSAPVASFTVIAVAGAYSLAVAGRPRRLTMYVVGAAVTLLALSRIYLGVDRVTDAGVAVIIGVSIPMVAFRYLVPDVVFPVSYRGGKKAHLELTPLRRNAIVTALADQLGLEVSTVDYIGLRGSGGSTPLCIELADGGRVFAKIYARTHQRSDRSYKMWRTVVYGSLEDEASFQTVRRLAQHEDYMMRLMADAGVRVPAALGVVEMTPGREYLLVTDFVSCGKAFDGGPLTDAAIDSGLESLRAMWDAGLAHRDIKPGNLIISGDDVWLIDHSFGQVRPSPWRQAVDLANLLMTLSLGSSPAAVFDRALRFFTADEIAEALAATASITVPRQLRAAIEADGRPIEEEFRALVPYHRPIAIQRWTSRRIIGVVTTVALLWIGLRLLWINLEVMAG